MYTSGALESENVPTPRTRICAPAPIWPDVGTTTTPGARPLSNPSTVGTAVVAMTSATFTVETVVPSSRFTAPPAGSGDDDLIELDRARREHESQVGRADAHGVFHRTEADSADVEHHGGSR